MVLAIIVGILVGAVSVVPFSFATRRIRKTNPTHSLELLGPFLLTIIISFLILIAGMIICNIVAHDLVLAYVIAELVTFIAGVIFFGLVLSRRQ